MLETQAGACGPRQRIKVALSETAISHLDQLCAERGQYRPQVVEAAVEQMYLAEGGAGRREAYSQYLEAKRRLLRPEAPPGESPPGEESLLRELTECREQLALYDLLLGYKEETVSLQAVTIDVLQGKIRKLEAQAENRRAAGFTEKCV
ncbi:hypothetical protein [Acutalibacter sp. JLR.KK004]|jgi:hypothetical protein|uniref:hypothetical protein n=1 Tax=Acutalibacter sp. JLR.KK004 TaxID=3112622 RepID=UPI002FF1E5A3